MSNICYVCGREMVEGAECCPHDEHIIPNALGGHLTSNYILCKTCGGSYSRGDRSFVDLFGCFVHNMEHRMLFDRGHSGTLVKGSYFDGDDKISINVNKDGATLQQPIVKEESDKVTIMANKTVAGQMRKKYEKEGKKVETVENLYGLLALNFSEGNADFNGQFKEGFVKMAVEFALHKGIGREQLDVALTINNDGSAKVNFDSIPVFPFVSMDRYSDVFERNRFDLEKLYPSHTLMLFNEGGYLFCYIDLFSTFQYYVMLGKNYKGSDVYHVYYQPLFAQREPYKYSREEVKGMRMSELHALVCELGIDYKDKPLDTIYDEIVEMSNKLSISRAYDDLTKAIPDCETVIATLATETYQDDEEEGVLPQEVIDEITENGKPDGYRRVLSKIVEGKMQHFSYPLQCNRLVVDDADYLRDYTNMKYHQLEDYSNGLQFQKQTSDYLNKK